MTNFHVCEAGPADLVAAELCLDELSKDFEGSLSDPESERVICRQLDCATLVVEQQLRAKVWSHDCDSELGKLFDGELLVRELTTVFAHGSGKRRGFHSGTFRWRTSAGIVQGHLRGMTNEGTHRKPAFDGCQKCGDDNVMEGRLCGRLVRPTDEKLAGIQVTAAYRIRYDSSEGGGVGGVAGTIEGLLIRTCGCEKDCGC